MSKRNSEDLNLYGDDDGSFPNSSSIPKIKRFDPNAISDPIQDRHLPESIKREIDKTVLTLLDENQGRVIVKGTSGSGKSYFISQLVYKFENSSMVEKSNNSTVFLYLSRGDTIAFEDPQSYIDEYFKCAKGLLGLEEREICIITDDTHLAGYLASVNSDAKVILEVSETTFASMRHAQAIGHTKVWSQWFTVDIMNLYITRSDLARFIHRGLQLGVGRVYGQDFRESSVSKVFDHILAKSPNLYIATKGDKEANPQSGEFTGESCSRIPFGVWASVMRRLVLLYSIDSEFKKCSSISDSILIDEAYSDCSYLFEEVENIYSRGFNMSDVEDGVRELLEEMDLEAEVNFIEDPEYYGIDESDEGETLKRPEYKDMKTLKKRLEESIKGQSHALEQIVGSMSLPAIGLNDPKKPIRTMLFLGMTGVGKTETCLKLAEELCEEKMNVIRLDMSEFSTKYESTKLFGSAPGYIGHDKDGGMLTKQILENPRSVVILDEVEKAHPKIWDNFLQVFDAGRLTTGSGVTVDFSQAIIIMTSNLGAKEMQHKQSGFSVIGGDQSEIRSPKEIKSIALKAMEKDFRPEFINRIDDIIVFEALTRDIARSIVSMELKKFSDNFERVGHKVNKPSSKVVDLILEESSFEKFGAREIQRKITDLIVKPAAQKVFESSSKSQNKTIAIGSSNGKITISEKVDKR